MVGLRRGPPIKDKSGKYSFFKLREDPSNGSDKITYPKGSIAQIYDWEILKKNTELIVICEGELDRLLLISKGLSAITSTHGVNTFKKEWVEELKAIKKIAVCFDNDQAGKSGSTKLLGLLKQKTTAKLYRIILPEEVGASGDVTDYFINCKGTINELLKNYCEEYPKKIDTSNISQLNADSIAEILGITIKQDNENKVVTFLCMVLAYTDNDQLNLSFNAPSSTGKSYIPLEIASLFPEEDAVEIGYCSPTAFFHDYGNFDTDFGGYIVNLSKKILIFLDQPHNQLLQHLRPILSHDKKEICMKVTDKTQKFGLKTKNIKLIGFPSVIFCTAGLKVNEQEATRFLLLSPETSQEKISQGVKFAIKKEADKQKYLKWLQDIPQRKLLVDRILAIKEQNIKEIVIEDDKKIEEKFCTSKKILKPRHQRDIKRVVSLIKAFALLNLWFRKRVGETIYASDDDIEEGFKIWNKISVSQELNIPPYVYNLYKEVIIPACEFKNSNSQFAVFEGITRKEVMSKHIEVYGRPINDFTLRQEILPMLEAAGLIIQEPDPDDKRKMLIYPIEQTG